MRSRMAILTLIFALCASRALAQSNPLYIQFRPGAVKGALYKPDRGPAPHSERPGAACHHGVVQARISRPRHEPAV